MRYPDTQSASQRQTPEDESQTPPNVPVSAISLPQPAGVAEQGSAQVKPSWFSLESSPPLRSSIARTSLSGNTAYEKESTTTSPRLWSCPTSNTSFSQAPTIYGCADPTPVHQNHPGSDFEAVGAWIHSLVSKLPKESHPGSSENRQDGDRTSEPFFNRIFARLPKLSEFLDKQKFSNSLKDVGSYNSLHQFTLEDSKEMPWTSFNLRVPDSICAFCGSQFTDPDHVESVTAHIRVKHCHPNQHQLLVPHPKQPRFHKHFTLFRNATNEGRSTSKLDGFSMNTNAQWREVSAMGSWAHKDLLTGREAPDIPPTPTHKHYVIECDNPSIPHDRLLFLLDSLDPSVNPRRANDFFNALDLILGNFLDKFPDDVMVLGIQRAVARLEHLYGVNFGSSAARQSKWTSTTAAQGVNSCAGSQENSLPADSSSKSPHTPSGRKAKKRGHTDPSGPGEENLGNPQNETKVKRRRMSDINRALLACPFRKHCEVYDQILCCRSEGETSMSGVTQHLHRRVHSQAVGVLTLCRNCWQYIMDQREYHSFHGSGRCTARPQPRGSLVAAQWYSLYRLLFPHSERIPSPYVGDTTWKPAHTFNQQHPDTEVGEPELDFNTFPTPQSFLEQPQAAILIEPLPAHNLPTQSQDATFSAADAAATELLFRMLSERVGRPHDLSDHYTSILMESASRRAPEELDAFFTRIRASFDEMVNFPQATARATTAQQPNAHSVDMQLPALAMQGQQYFNIIPPDGQWIGQFPVPPHLREIPEQIHTTPEQPLWGLDTLLHSDEELNILPGLAVPNYSTFFPEIDYAQMFSGYGFVNRDGSARQRAIST